MRLYSETETKQKKQLKKLKEEVHWMKIAIIGAVVFILLLLLLLGYATDWAKGLRGTSDKAAGITPTASSVKDPAGTDGTGTSTASTGNGGNGSSGGTGGNGGNGSSTGDPGGGPTTTNTTTTNTTNNTTTTNNGGDPPPAQPPTSLIDLDANVGVGKSLDSVIELAKNLGLAVDCSQNLLLKTCTFNKDGYQITVRSLLSTGLITSVLSDLDNIL